MPRSGGGGGFRSGGGGFRSGASPAPVPASQNGGSRLGRFGSSIADGLGWGASNAVSHRAVDAVLGPRTIHVQHEQVSAPAPSSHYIDSDACSSHNKAFQECVNNHSDDISRCQIYLDMLSECRQSSG
ncbi:hypothetical protein AQUCO_00700531v1 [Aquilegia coerulea]|uniref:CHCH domain-containing protein n=1 Tax=Aquilegia coerulea TaxID=218851 RepID=A0A2G5EKG8_AQUCA|nr:hypothetical protein AQUCO_00700531v1 [Aquilegia coerulea]